MKPQDKKVNLYVFLTWLGCIVAAGIGAFFSGLIAAVQDDHATFGSGLNFILYDFFIFIAAFIASIYLPRKVGIKLSGDKKNTNQQVISLALILISIPISLFFWRAGIGERVLYAALGASAIVEIALYFIVSQYIFTSQDKTRVRVWSLVYRLTIIAVPIIIMQAISSRI